ncbi:uncharacterized protein LOC123924464 [Trifolium pratense]|uniref:uncharacterized protein LOC123924464 n=1 Tax=Trifolium pratense TaxID=57577 RepID=UPI001E691703|nr:uncharacterized protein LOC123924464 [Trifolium pratense]
MITTRMQEINKPAVKTIQSHDGDIIDCVLSHEQPAFDHPLLKGQKPLDPPEIPKEHNQMDNLNDIFQLWNLNGESCPEGTIPIRRTKEQDILRAGSISRFGRKILDENLHVHSIGYVNGDFYGARSTLNVWTPQLEGQLEFSLAQMWIISDSSQDDRNTLEAGWQVYPRLYGDNKPRLFIYWTADGYQHSGCYNLKCSGFVQVNKNIVLGGAISPISTYNGNQFDIKLTIWKDPKDGNWWLALGSTVIGYWPSSLFPKLKDTAHSIHFGGEIVNEKITGSHTSTQMGSGHFAEEREGKAAYIRNLEVVNTDHLLHPLTEQPQFFVLEPNCYNIKGESSEKWGQYFFYGGPGRNEKCP